MKHALLITLLAAHSFAIAQSPSGEVLKGKAAAADVMTPIIFMDECTATSEGRTGRLHCIARAPDVEKGAKFMHELVLREDRQGPMNRAHKFLQMKNFAEAAYDECIMRRADDPGLSAGLRLEDGLCGLTRIDVLEGMRIFTKTLGR